MSDSLFLLGGDGSLRTMAPAPFASEDVFQALLERHPALLTDSTFGEAEPRRWALIKREKSVADSDASGGRWSLDHLFVDQDGVPTLVEIKRATDTRARREVVAQMLDYAANAVSWWKVDELASEFASTCEASGTTAALMLAERLGIDPSVEESFWRSVQANLKSGRIRLIFVADIIYPELQRIVEFLNEQMDPAVVLALELRPYQSGDDRLIAPKVIGQTQKAQAAKAVSSDTPRKSVDEWLDQMPSGWPAARRSAFDQMLRIFRLHADALGTNRMNELTAIARMGSGNRAPLSVTKGGSLQLNLGYVASGALADESLRREVLNRFNSIPGVKLSTDNPRGFPTVALESIGEESWLLAESTVAWFLELARQQTSAGIIK